MRGVQIIRTMAWAATQWLEANTDSNRDAGAFRKGLTPNVGAIGA